MHAHKGYWGWTVLLPAVLLECCALELDCECLLENCWSYNTHLLTLLLEF